MATVKPLARKTPWVKKHRVSVSQIAGPVLGAVTSPNSSATHWRSRVSVRQHAHSIARSCRDQAWGLKHDPELDVLRVIREQTEAFAAAWTGAYG